ncbi:serum albumin-like [Ambystoma mexicanum]|uniref:serum albumin-like n=1 Tax=Ambystoma mexicanum TaxID=8296 RepID=UPI0037E75BE6
MALNSPIGGIIMFSQYLQKCSYEKQVERVKAITELAEKCSMGILTAECGKPLRVVALNEMCKTPLDGEKYPAHAECCAKPDPDRNICFLSHKIIDGLLPFKKLEPEHVCTSYKEDRFTFMGNYLHEVVRRHPFLSSLGALSLAGQFEKMAVDCCNEFADTMQCFTEKMPAHVGELQEISHIQSHNCHILYTNGEKVFEDIKIIQMSQKFPKASFENILMIAAYLVDLHQDCCNGDMMGCLIDRMELNSKMCKNQDALSSKLKQCCAKNAPECSECIIKIENDDMPAELSLQVHEFIDHPDVCKQFVDQKSVHVRRFSYEYSRRHPEFSVQLLKRICDGYQESLTQCCQEEDPSGCSSKMEEFMKKEISESQQLLKKNCDDLKNIGEYNFQNELLIQYSKKIPQLPAKSLIAVTNSMTNVDVACCKVKEARQMACSEGGVDRVIGSICRMQETLFVNARVSQCCRAPYANRRKCLTGLSMDGSYFPQMLSPDHFKFTADLCTLTSHEDLKIRKKTFLVRLVKQKLDIEDDELKPIFVAFLSMMDQCCKAENQEDCFTVEGPKLIETCQRTFESKASDKVAVLSI